MPSKKKSSRSNSNLAKSRVKKISVKLLHAENKIHRNKDIPVINHGNLKLMKF